MSDKYVLKDINQNFKVVSSGVVDHDIVLYKFVGFNSTKRQPFYSYVSHADELSQLWHARLGHLNYGKMQLLSKWYMACLIFRLLKVFVKVVCLVNIIEKCLTM